MFQKSIFKEKTILVTGGGSGIGLSIATSFLQHGAKEVYIASRKQERLDKAIIELHKHGSCKAFPLDIREPERIAALADLIESSSGQLDILINNAGGQFPSAAQDISPNGWNAVINTNLNGTWYVSQEMAKRFFLKQESGIILNIIANIYKGFPGMSHTGAARAGVDNLTKSLAVEWARKNIRVNAVAPGVIKSTALANYPEELTKGISSKIPMGKLGRTQDVANLVLFLCSPLASYITGETIYIDGGWRLWGDLYDY